MAASVRLKEASEVLSETPTALKLRYLQTLQTISAEKSATIVFPIPMDMFPESIHTRIKHDGCNIRLYGPSIRIRIFDKQNK